MAASSSSSSSKREREPEQHEDSEMKRLHEQVEESFDKDNHVMEQQAILGQIRESVLASLNSIPYKNEIHGHTSHYSSNLGMNAFNRYGSELKFTLDFRYSSFFKQTEIQKFIDLGLIVKQNYGVFEYEITVPNLFKMLLHLPPKIASEIVKLISDVFPCHGRHSFKYDPESFLLDTYRYMKYCTCQCFLFGLPNPNISRDDDVPLEFDKTDVKEVFYRILDPLLSSSQCVHNQKLINTSATHKLCLRGRQKLKFYIHQKLGLIYKKYIGHIATFVGKPNQNDITLDDQKTYIEHLEKSWAELLCDYCNFHEATHFTADDVIAGCGKTCIISTEDRGAAFDFLTQRITDSHMCYYDNRDVYYKDVKCICMPTGNATLGNHELFKLRIDVEVESLRKARIERNYEFRSHFEKGFINLFFKTFVLPAFLENYPILDEIMDRPNAPEYAGKDFYVHSSIFKEYHADSNLQWFFTALERFLVNFHRDKDFYLKHRETLRKPIGLLLFVMRDLIKSNETYLNSISKDSFFSELIYSINAGISYFE